MAEDGQDAEDRTEAASPRRLEKARAEGQVALSRELVGFAALTAATLAMGVTLPSVGPGWLMTAQTLLEQAGAAPAGAGAVAAMMRQTLLLLAPVIVAAALAAVAATVVQTGWLVRAEAIAPDLSRLDPLGAAKRLFGAQGLVELVRTLLKLALVAVALWSVVDPDRLAASLAMPPGTLLTEAGTLASRLMLAALLALAGIAALDVVHARWKHARDLRMSREDVRQELKESEGDPHIRARLRQLRQRRARQRMLAAVPKAAVIVTNPTHYAVALAYDRGGAAAPRLVAKGVDALAARIREVAAEHGVPTVANPPLARALHRLEVDTEIPPEHWQAVANIIAFIWGLRERPDHA